MKKIIVATFAAVVLTTTLPYSSAAQGQNKSNRSLPHKVGLIDMAHVFKHYKKFEVLREDLRNEISQSDAKAKQLAEDIKGLQDEMKAFKKDSADFLSRESELAKLTSDFQTFRKVEQQKFLRKESQIYKTVYLEVVDAVRKAGEAWEYTLIIRFNREELDTTDPQKLIQGMNRQVVFHRGEDDITESVLDYLNRKYEAQSKPQAGKRRGSARK